MKQEEKLKKEQELFNSISQNAFDFLDHAIDEFKENPKYSIINFYAAIELLLKARLLLEHWSLVFEKPDEANMEKLLSGAFKSVSLPDIIRRLEQIAKVRLPPKAIESFNELREHRNKLIHFYHKGYASPIDDQSYQEAISKECKGWFYLHQMLTKELKADFAVYVPTIDDIGKKMFKNREYLQAKYDHLKGDIIKGEERGVLFQVCSFCGFKAVKDERTELGPLLVVACLVCESQLYRLLVECPGCSGKVYIEDLGEGECDSCERPIDIDDLLEIYGEFKSPKEEAMEQCNAYCPECDRTEKRTVVPIDDKWLCLSCMAYFDGVDYCRWCGEKVAGEIEDSELVGCPMCEGRLGDGD